MTPARPALRDLAAALGILSEHVSVSGDLVKAGEATLVSLAAAMGHAAGTEAEAEASLATLGDHHRASHPRPAQPDPEGGCLRIEEVLSGRHVFGIFANLWSLRSARSQGVGDFTDLAALAEWAASVGAAFVGVGPLAATRGDTEGACPYSPVTREFLSPLHADILAVPEMETSIAARRLLKKRAVELTRLRAAPRLDARAVLAWKFELLRALHAEFIACHEGRNTPRGEAHARFLADEGQRLLDFATWCSLDEERRDGTAAALEPGNLPGARSPEAAAHRERRATEVSFHLWLQFELDRQLACAAERARRVGLPLGLHLDLPLGTARDGFDSWAAPGDFVMAASLGAPPDPLGPEGQDWDLPPEHPVVARLSGEAHWRRVLRATLRHAGLLRIDHALGLARLFWVPRGLGAAAGAYVRQDPGALLSVLAEESRRAGAVIVGEDLGTAAPGLRDAFAAWGLLGTRVLPFERSSDGSFLPAAAYATDVMVCASTHDLPPLAGWWEGADLALREGLGLLTGEALDRARASRQDERERLVQRLLEEGLVTDASTLTGAVPLVAAVHEFLSWSGAAIVSCQLDDLCGETEPANLPGVQQSVHPSWTRRMTLSLEELADDPLVRQRLAGLERRRFRQ